MKLQTIPKEIKNLEIEYKSLKKELKCNRLITSKKNTYTKQDKNDFLILWKKYIKLFRRLQYLIKKTKYRRFFVFINYDKLVIRRYLLIFYFNCLVDVLKIFWKHEEFLRVFLKENVKYDYWKIAKYIYRPEFINLINTPSIFLIFSKSKINKNFLFMIEKEKTQIWNLKIILTDYKNFYYYFRNKAFKVIFIVSKRVSNVIARTRFSTRTKWLIKNKHLEKYLDIAKPWDIFLTRWNWNASNISIPGFWKHMSMYIWTWKYLKKNFTHSSIKKLDDNSHYVIEATGEGINIDTIQVLLSHNDYLGVSRTSFKKEKIIRTINNTLKNIWKWYDYIFDFNSDKNLVCSELVLKSYAKEFEWDSWINIKLENIWISLTYPPNKFLQVIFNDEKVMKPVLFIDSIEKTWKNFINTNNEFNKSQYRSRFSFFLK